METPLFEQDPRASTSRWQIKKREIIHKNPWYEYRHDSGLTDKGKPFDYYYVYYDAPSAIVVALTPEREMILVKQYRYAVSRDSLQLPGGRAKNVSVQQAAVQELREETGYTPATVTKLGKLDYTPGTSTGKVEIFLALNCRREGEQDLEESEAGMTVQLHSIVRVYEMAEQGVINDTVTLAALLKARPHLPGAT